MIKCKECKEEFGTLVAQEGMTFLCWKCNKQKKLSSTTAKYFDGMKIVFTPDNSNTSS